MKPEEGQSIGCHLIGGKGDHPIEKERIEVEAYERM